MRRPALIRQAGLTLVLAALAACGNDHKKSKATPASADAEAALDGFTVTPATESALNQSVLDDPKTAAAMRVVTLYFTGGSGDNCATWNVTVKATGVQLAVAAKLDQASQALLSKDGDDKLTGKFETRGAKPGIRILVPDGKKIALSGTQTFCKGNDSTEFDVSLNGAKRALSEVFSGVEDPGQASVKAEIGDAKPAPGDTATDKTTTGKDQPIDPAKDGQDAKDGSDDGKDGPRA